MAKKVNKPVQQATAVTVTPKTVLARQIYAANVGKKTRKEIIGLFQTEAGLTENGAATYYQNIRKAEKQATL